MSESPIKYRLIKKEKHTGARLGRNYHTPWNLPNAHVYASWDSGNGQDSVARRIERDGVQELSFLTPYHLWLRPGDELIAEREVFTSS